MQKCQACGIEKDENVLELYPYTEDNIIDEPVRPFFEYNIQPEDDNSKDWRKAEVICHECFHKLDGDMWIRESNWDSLNPIIPFKMLPLLED